MMRTLVACAVALCIGGAHAQQAAPAAKAAAPKAPAKAAAAAKAPGKKPAEGKAKAKPKG